MGKDRFFTLSFVWGHKIIANKERLARIKKNFKWTISKLVQDDTQVSACSIIFLKDEQ